MPRKQKRRREQAPTFFSRVQHQQAKTPQLHPGTFKKKPGSRPEQFDKEF